MKTIKKQLRRAFTIVELVIVIAVIAALAAILIPTFVNVLDSANESVDTSLVKNLNTALASEEILHGAQASTMSEALEWVEDNGYKVENLTPTSSGDIVWDQDSNRFLLVDEEGNIAYQDGTTSETVTDTKYKLWYIAQSETDVAKATYSYYVNYATTSVTATYGVDVGENENVDVTITGVESSTDLTVIVNTNGGTLTVNAANYDVSSYGTAANVTITAVSMNSFHVYGKVDGTVTLAAGHLDIKASATVKSVYVTASDSSSVKLTNSSSNKIEVAGSDSSVAKDLANGVQGAESIDVNSTLVSYFNGGLGTENSPFLISTAKQFNNIYNVSANASTYGYDTENKVYYKLANDVTLNNYWTFSDATTAYGGFLYYAVFDGDGCTLDATNGSASYLFRNMKDSELKNVNVELGNNTYSMVLWLSGESTYTSVDAAGEIMFGSGNAGVYSIYTYGTITFNNCTNYTNINGYGDYAAYNAIFVGYNTTATGWDLTLTFNNCVNEGSIVCGKAAMFVGNYCSSANTHTLIINNCSNNGEIRSTYQSYTPDYYIASGGVYSKGTFILDGTTYTSASDVPTLDKVYQGPNDTTNIAINSDGYFYITESGIGSANTYVISIGLYTNVYDAYGGGTARYYVKLTVGKDDLASGEYVSDLQKLQFIDLATYLDKADIDSFDGVESDTVKAVGDGYMVRITEGEGDDAKSTWYYLINNEQCYLSKNTANATIFCVSVFDKNSQLLSSTSI